MKPLCVLLALTLTACSHPAPLPWQVGYWFWQGSSALVTSTTPIDVLYYQERVPEEQLPPAKEYWKVYRGPNSPVYFDYLQENARGSRIQLDIDCPTDQLKTYAANLHHLRKVLPPDARISITALLDWFREGTDIAEVINVPQFYDTADSGNAIAAPVNAAKWSSVFSRFNKPFCIGVSTFGRATNFSNAVPLDLATASGSMGVNCHSADRGSPSHFHRRSTAHHLHSADARICPRCYGTG